MDSVDAYSPIVAAGTALIVEVLILVLINPEPGPRLWMYVVGPAALVGLITPCRHRRLLVTSEGGMFGAGGTALGGFLAVLIGVAIPPLFTLVLLALPTLLAFLASLVGHG